MPDGHGGGELHGVGCWWTPGPPADQRQQQIAAWAAVLPLGQLLLGHALQPQLLGLQMDGDVNAGEVQHGGQDGLQSHLGIGDAHVLGHQEGGGAHDGGHDLAAGGGGRLNGSGKFGLVARLFHHGDGDGAGGHGVAHGGAGHHAAQGGGDHGHLGGAAGGPAGQRGWPG